MPPAWLSLSFRVEMSAPHLPEESLDRLSTIAALALGLPSASTGNHAGVRAAILSVPGPFPEEGVACDDVTGVATSSHWNLPSNSRSYLALPLATPEGTPIHSGSDRDLVLCIALPATRSWSPADRVALRAVAATAAVEVRLRSDATRLERTAEDARSYPLHDPLTELAHRELFLDRVGMTLLRTARYQDRHFAVLSLRVEQFAHIETGFGYDTAREVLREFATRLKTVVRGYDSIARLAGDEFGILLESIRDDSDAARVANRMHEALRVPIRTGPEEFIVTANIGIVLSHSGVDSASRIVQLAGLARERARNSGAPYEIFDPSMQQRAQARLQKETELRRAVEGSQFDLHYQPIIALGSGKISGAEALLRWNHPSRGVVSAGEFIGLAEEAGLSVPLGTFAINHACAQLTSWSTTPALAQLDVSVNITAAQFRHRDAARQLTDQLGGAIARSRIHLEVTERMLIGDPAFAKEVLEALRALGIRIHLDDFGTGYSSLQYLHELPLDAIKIDRSFIARLPKGGRDAQVVTTIRELARQIGVPVIAEGVETPEHLALIRDIGCEFAQGYYLSRPIPAGDLAALVARDPVW